MMNNRLNFRHLVLVLLVFALVAPAASAQLVQCGRNGQPECEVSDIYETIYRLLSIGLGLAGLVAMLFVVIGGSQMLLSAGEPTRVAEGKKTIFNAILGLVLIMASYIIVSYLASTLGLTSGGDILRGFLP